MHRSAQTTAQHIGAVTTSTTSGNTNGSNDSNSRSSLGWACIYLFKPTKTDPKDRDKLHTLTLRDGMCAHTCSYSCCAYCRDLLQVLRLCSL
jgi:hypothetical protein